MSLTEQTEHRGDRKWLEIVPSPDKNLVYDKGDASHQWLRLFKQVVLGQLAGHLGKINNNPDSNLTLKNKLQLN